MAQQRPHGHGSQTQDPVAAAGAFTGLPRRRVLAAGFGFGAAGLMPRRGNAAAYVPKPLAKGETVSVILGVGGIDSEPAYLGVWLPLYGGYFDALKADGITVNVVPFPSGGADAILGLASGRTQINYQSAENAIRAQAQGRDATVIYNAMPTPGVFIMARRGLEARVKTVADVKGLRWGVTGFGASAHTVSLRAARYGGVDPAAISWISLGGLAGFMPSVREGRVDVFAATPSQRAAMLQDGLAYDLLDLFHRDTARKVYGHDYIGLGLLTLRSYSDQNPFVVYKVIEATHKAIAAGMQTPPEKLAAILPAQFQTPLLIPTIQTMLQGFGPDGYSDPADAANMIADLTTLKLISRPVDAASVVDNRFVEALRDQGTK